MGDRTGQQLGNYRLVEFLGQGGFAEVYRGEHLHLGTPAAIKILRTQFVAEESQQFLNEARTLVTLEHEAIIKFKDCGIENNTPFLIMDYAPYGTLRQRHPRGSRVPLQTALTYVQQIASALYYAHGHQIVHRDVKPENMLIGARQNVLLSDFGIAVLLSTSTSQHSKVIAGTALYMAPEQILSQPQPASDQYALAVILYEWLCGTPPFRGSFAELTAKHLHALPPSCRTIDPTFPLAIEQVLFKALAKAPEQRFASMQEFAAAFAQATSNASLSTHSLSTNGTWERSFVMVHPTTSIPSHAVSSFQAPFASPNNGPLSHPSGVGNPLTPVIPPIPPVTIPLGTQPPLPINEEDVLRRVRRGDLPARWHLLQPSLEKVGKKSWQDARRAFFESMPIIYSLLFNIPRIFPQFVQTLLPSPVWSPNMSSIEVQQYDLALQQYQARVITWIIIAFIVIPLIVGLLSGYYAKRRAFNVYSQRVLVLLPEGLVYGQRDKQKATLVVNYKDVIKMQPRERYVRIVFLKGEKKWLVFLLRVIVAVRKRMMHRPTSLRSPSPLMRMIIPKSATIKKWTAARRKEGIDLSLFEWPGEIALRIRDDYGFFLSISTKSDPDPMHLKEKY